MGMGLTSRYNTYIWTGLVMAIVGLGLGLLRDLNRLVLVNGSAPGLQAALIRERLFEHTTEQWLLLSLAVLKLGIGSAIATIVLHLVATGRKTVETFRFKVKSPWFARAFVPLLFIGFTGVATVFALTIWWDLNAVRLIRLEFVGQQYTAAYQAALLAEKVLDHLIKPGKFVGTALLILGIALGLATIVANLSFQARLLPRMTGKYLGKIADEEMAQPYIPSRLIAVAITGAVVAISGTVPFAILRTQYGATVLRQELAGRVPSIAHRAALTGERLLEHVIDPWIFVGLASLLLAINFLLLTIIRLQRAQRSGIGDLVQTTTGLLVPPVERPLWTTRLAPWFAVAGFLIVLLSFVPVSVIRVANELKLLGEGFAGRMESSVFQSALQTELILDHLIKPGQFVGMAFLMVGIGFTLVTIVVNLRLTALILPPASSRLFAVAREEPVAPLDGKVADPMSLAPWALFAPLLVGAVITTSATVPLALVRVSQTVTYLGEQFAGLEGSPVYRAALLTDRLLEHSILPWKLFGMGLIFFAIGRFFATIIGFVRARSQMIDEAVTAVVAMTGKARV